MDYQISTLLYGFDAADRVLLLERAREPNRGLWSPPGGKLETASGESPHGCAIREAGEELGLTFSVTDLRLTGIVSEHGFLIIIRDKGGGDSFVQSATMGEID